MAWKMYEKVKNVDGGMVYTWVLSSQRGVPVQIAGYPDKSFQVSSYTNGTVTAHWSDVEDAGPDYKATSAGVQVSEGQANTLAELRDRAFAACRDITHTAISKTSADGEEIIEHGIWFQPRNETGAATVKLFVSNVSRKGAQ